MFLKTGMRERTFKPKVYAYLDKFIESDIVLVNCHVYSDFQVHVSVVWWAECPINSVYVNIKLTGHAGIYCGIPYVSPTQSTRHDTPTTTLLFLQRSQPGSTQVDQRLHIRRQWIEIRAFGSAVRVRQRAHANRVLWNRGEPCAKCTRQRCVNNSYCIERGNWCRYSAVRACSNLCPSILILQTYDAHLILSEYMQAASKYINRTCDISFNVTALVSMSNNESAASAEVWVLKQRLSNREIEELSSGGCNTTSVVLQLSPTSDGVATPSHSRVTLERDDLKKDTWIRFDNLTDLYTKWIGDQTGGIQRLTISAPEGCSSARLGFVASASDTSERKPILVVFINDYHPAADFDGRIVPDGNFGLQKNSTAPNSLVKRYQPTQPEAGQLSACHLVPSQVK